MPYEKAGKVTIWQFELYAEARHKQQDELNRRMATQAWLGQAVQATRKNGKSVYEGFEDFYNKMFKSDKPDKRKLSLAERNYLLNKKRGGKWWHIMLRRF